MIPIGTANLNGQSYELRRRNIAGSYTWWIDDVAAIEGTYSTFAEAIDALWEQLGIRAAPGGWWASERESTAIPAAARLPRTVTEQEQRLGLKLEDLLRKHELQLTDRRGCGVPELELGLAYQLAEALVLEVRAEELLEQLAVEHEIECELQQLLDGGWVILPPGDSPDDYALLATGSTPLEAVEELRRDLEAPSLHQASDEDLLLELLSRARGRVG
jgi:hypothetical protein